MNNSMQRIISQIAFLDGREIEIPVIIADQIAYSNAARKFNWPSAEKDPMLAGIYFGFAAAKRTGEFEGTWDEFTHQVVQVTARKEDVNPTMNSTQGD